MTMKELCEIAKTITIGDIIGAASLFGILVVCLFFAMVLQ